MMYITSLPPIENRKGGGGKQKLWNECEVQNDLIQSNQIMWMIILKLKYWVEICKALVL